MSITTNDFKEYFVRDFPYLPVWDATVSYNTGEVVYYINRLFYSAIVDSAPAGTLPTNTTYWEKIEADVYDYIGDTDITRAIGECDAMLPVARFETEVLTMAQEYLTAHCLCTDIRRSNSGLASQISFPTSSKSAGSISESYSVPQKFLEDPIYNFYLNSDYGLKYLALLIPRIRGNIAVAYGATTA